jgi:hypothetical protein
MQFAYAIIGASLLSMAAAASAAPGDADAPFFIHPATVSQPARLTAHERQNLDMVLRWWREVVEARHNGFDIVRIQNGKIQEHWDSSEKFSSSPAFVPSTAPAPSVWNAGALSATAGRNAYVASDEAPLRPDITAWPTRACRLERSLR